MFLSGCTHDDRSKKMNSSAFACGVMPLLLHSVGKGLLGSELSPPTVCIVTGSVAEAFMCKSVITARPHCMSSAAVEGVLNVKYCTDFRILLSFGLTGTVTQSWVGAFTASVAVLLAIEASRAGASTRRARRNQAAAPT